MRSLPLAKTLLSRPGLAAIAVAAAIFAAACSPPGTAEEHVQNIFGDVTPQAHRIIQCESNWNAGAVSPTNDHGLFQINHIHRQAFTAVTGQPWSAVYDPYWNTVYAKHLYDQSGWQPWTCRKAL